MSEKQTKVLLLEDDAESADLVEQMMAAIKNRKVLSVSAPNLSKALELMKQFSFDAIISDLDLPDSSGLNTFSALRAQDKRTPIIILTGIDDASMAIQAVHQGAQDYLVKT